MTYWLSYGGGVNSTALLVLLVDGKLPQYEPWRAVFADTGDERPQTYAYIKGQIEPWLAQRGRELEIVRPKETVLERWERLQVTGSRRIRSCTDEAKLKPIARHIEANGGRADAVQVVGIDAGEPHRARPARPGDMARVYPLVEMGIDRAGCADIIRAAGLCVPIKSGCWHCPFLRVGEVVRLAREAPERFERIAALEDAATAAHGPEPGEQSRMHWNKHPAAYWRDRAALPMTADLDWDDEDEGEPCECYR